MPLHVKTFGDWREFKRERRSVKIEILELPFHPHEEEPECFVLMLVSVKDVAVMAVHKVGDSGNEPLAIGAVDQQDSRFSIRFVSFTTGNPLKSWVSTDARTTPE